MRTDRGDPTELDCPIALDEAIDATGRADSGLLFSKRERACEPLGIIDCQENARSGMASNSADRAVRLAMLASAASIALMLGSSVARFESTNRSGSHATAQAALAVAAPVAKLPPPDLLRPLSPEEATKENAERSFADRPDTPASRFVLRAAAEDKERALTCLTQAVYYEAAGEGTDGGRAVAQVVLNRARHPGYPASICGVVYEGSDRPTGCQFTFTCDGSLLRTPNSTLWARSRKIAADALAGHVFAPIGHATSYHADYVLPYWADSLDKMVQIGRHIFYRLRGTYGDSGSFFQRYAGAEPQLPDPRAAVVLPASSATAELASTLISDNINGGPGEVEKPAAPATRLAIDSAHGTLIGDTQEPPIAAHRNHASADCATSSDSKQLAPLGATDMRSGVPASRC